MNITSINQQTFGKIIFKDNTEQYIMKDAIPSVLQCHDNNTFYDKFDKLSASDTSDITIEKQQGKYRDYLIFTVTKNGKLAKRDYHYCLNTKESKQELYDTFVELMDIALYKKIKN